MRFRQNKVSYKYKLVFFKEQDFSKVKHPAYLISKHGSIKQGRVWKQCRYSLLKISGDIILEVKPAGLIKDGMSDLGPINQQNYFNRIKLSWLNRNLIFSYHKLYDFKISLLKLSDRIKPIRSNLRYILFAIIGSGIYYFINEFFDNLLQKLINESNFIQSLIVFLSLSSIINIFHPFTLRRELNITEVDELVNKKTKDAVESYKKQLERQNDRRRNV